MKRVLAGRLDKRAKALFAKMNGLDKVKRREASRALDRMNAGLDRMNESHISDLELTIV